jgi:hypothetical protein
MFAALIFLAVCLLAYSNAANDNFKGVFATQTFPTISVAVDNPSAYAQRYAGTVLGMNAGHLLDSLHFLSVGGMTFARGLNDTPKIAALGIVTGQIKWKPMMGVLASWVITVPYVASLAGLAYWLVKHFEHRA